MNMKMCFVNTAMAATCFAAQGGVVPANPSADPTSVPPTRAPSVVEGTVHASPDDGAGPNRRKADRATRGCGDAPRPSDAPKEVARTADQWDRWFVQHNMR